MRAGAFALEPRPVRDRQRPGPASVPALGEQPRARRRERRRARVSLRCELGVKKKVVEDVSHGPSNLGGRFQLSSKIVIRKDASLPGGGAIDRPRDAHRQPLHPARQRVFVRRLDDQVNVVPLHRIVHHAKVGTIAASAERLAYSFDDVPPPKPGSVVSSPQDGMDGKPRLMGGSFLVRDAPHRPLGLAPGPLPPPAPRPKFELFRSWHLDWGLYFETRSIASVLSSNFSTGAKDGREQRRSTGRAFVANVYSRSSDQFLNVAL